MRLVRAKCILGAIDNTEMVLSNAIITMPFNLRLGNVVAILQNGGFDG